MFVDYHVHSEYSDDSVYPMEQVVRDAIELGLEELCFTDHVDYGIKFDRREGQPVIYRKGAHGEPDNMPLANVDYPRYVAEIRDLQRRYGRQIQIRLGLEFGMQAHTIPEFEVLFSRYDFDFIILSLHAADGKEFWTQDYQEGKTQQEYVEGYYKSMLHLVRQYKNYSVLGHMDLINRYDKAGLYPFEKVKPLITEILQTVIRDQKGLEVNTSSYRYGLSDLCPSLEILRLYRELGGRLVTIGSDSHKKEHLGQAIPETLETLKSLGFTEICTFQRMRPIFHSL